MLLKMLFHISWDFITSLVKKKEPMVKKIDLSKIFNVLFNNKPKISIASIRKDNVTLSKKQKIEIYFSCDIR